MQLDAFLLLSRRTLVGHITSTVLLRHGTPLACRTEVEVIRATFILAPGRIVQLSGARIVAMDFCCCLRRFRVHAAAAARPTALPRTCDVAALDKVGYDTTIRAYGPLAADRSTRISVNADVDAGIGLAERGGSALAPPPVGAPRLRM
ncbi:hypothetical protein B0H15DRAFT_945864 [Mycena belliarum]|uniref:Uncharacterized protein n=1 Tax=Mycena belliarum TaxID=1033014 RepID=A0AAD6UFV6_9AGAR|nr:hypothetical protein B0H15DRAFT_945864 [Mycena belliae]